MPDPLIGRQLGKYLIQQEIGRGGMARVYRALDTVLQRPVALKVLAPSLSADPEFARRFEREAITAANLRHPAIVTIFDVGEADGLRYIAMEYIGGRTLNDVLVEQGKLGVPMTIALIAPVAEALDFAHSHGMVHRDVKPHNIMLDTDGRVLLTDFGIAIDPAENTERLTRTGIFMGTPEYISPEQAQAQPLTGRSDLYSLGIVTYEMLAGQVPFAGGTAQQIMAHVYQAPPSLTSLDPHSPPELDQIFTRVLAKDPNQRFEHAGNLVEALRFVARRYGMPTASRDEVAALAIPRDSSAGQATIAIRTPASGYPASPPAGAAQPTSRRTTPPAAFPIADVFGNPQGTGHAQPTQAVIGQPATGTPAAGTRATSGATARQTTGRGYAYPGGDDRFVPPPPRLPPRRAYDEDGGSNMSWTLLALGAIGIAAIILIILLVRNVPGLFGPTQTATNPFTPQPTETPLPTATAVTPTRPPFVVPPLVGTQTVPTEELPTPELPTSTPTAEPSAVPTPEPPTSTPIPEPPTSTPTPEPPTSTPTAEPSAVPTLEPIPDTPTALPTNPPNTQPTPGTPGGTPIGGGGSIAYFADNTLNVFSLEAQQGGGPFPHSVEPSGPPSLSPDGNTILLDVVDPKTKTRQIGLIERNKGTLTMLTNDTNDNYHPSWRADGLAIVFASRKNGDADLFIMSADGSTPQQLTSGPGDDQYPSFSADDSRILFESTRDGPAWAIYTIDPQGGSPTRISAPNQAANDRSPRWSPDGQQIAFASDRDFPAQRTEIYVQRLQDGSVERITTFESGSANGPTWSPDGKLIALFGDRYGSNDIHIVDLAADTLLPSPANDQNAQERWPIWSK